MSFLSLKVKSVIRLGDELATVSTDSALEDKKVICLFFSALWCPPCRPFCQLLKAAYDATVSETNDIEIVFVSSDRNEEKMKQYINEYHGNWFAVPFDPQTAHRLKTEFKINSMPKLIVCKNDGSVITENGKELITRSGPEAMFKWIKCSS